MATKTVTPTVPGEVTETSPEQAQIAQLEGIVAVQDQRIKELAGYQAQARDLQDAVTNLTEKLTSAETQRDQATKEASQAQAAALSASASATTDQSTVAYAKSLAAAVKGLIG